jgi:hypothetical protein
MRPASSPSHCASLLRGGRIRPLRLVCLLAFATIPAVSGWAQGTPGPPTTIWIHQFGSRDFENAGSIAVSEDDVYVTSFAHGPAVLRHYGADGSVAWENDIASGSSSPVAVWAERDQVCVGGTARRPLVGDPGTIVGSAGYVRCFAPDGSILWTQYIEGTAVASQPQAAVYAVSGDRDQVLVVGTTTNALQACSRRAGCRGGRGPAGFAQRYRARDGVLVWSGDLGNTAYDVPLGIELESSGVSDVWGVRYQRSPIAFKLETYVWLRQLDGNGEIKSTAEIPWGFDPWPTAFALAGTAFYVAGPDEAGARVRRYDWNPQQGTLQPGTWSVLLPGAEVGALRLRGSRLLVAGKQPPATGPAGLPDAFVREYDAEGGAELWSLPFGTTGADHATAVVGDAGRVYVAGYTAGALGGPNAGGTDTYVARFAEAFEAQAGGPYSVDEGSTVLLSATAIAGDYGQTVTYAWDLGGDGVFEEPGQTVAYSPPDNTAEPVTVRVRVRDDYSLGTAEAPATVAVANVPPIVDAGPDAFLVMRQLLSRSVVFTDPGADTWSAVVDWGDGSVATSSGLSTRSFTVAHAYESSGTYLVTVTVTDKDGGQGGASFRATAWAHAITIADIVAAVQSLVDQGVLNGGQGSSLTGKLQDAQTALDAGNVQAAAEVLNAFINEVQALQSAGILDSSQAANLIAMARAVIASISG